MRKHFFMAGCALLMFMSACNKDEVKVPGDGSSQDGTQAYLEYVTLSATKSDYDAQIENPFNPGDEISVCSWIGTETKDENYLSKNAVYKCNDSGFFLPSTEADTLKWKGTSVPHYIVATSPKQQGEIDVRNFTFNSAEEDLFIARCLGENAAMPVLNDTVPVEFKRVLAKVVVSFDFKGDFQGATANKVKFRDVAEEGTLDMITNVLEATGNKEDKEFEKDGASFYAVLVPQTANNLYAEISYGSNNAYIYNKEITLSPGTINKFVFTPDGEDKLKLVSVTVEDWVEDVISLHKKREGQWSGETVTAEGNVYKVWNGGQLYYALNNMSEGHTVQLQNDIDLSAHYWQPVTVEGTGSNQDQRKFIDGNGYSIKGLCVDASKYASNTNAAFFGSFKHALVYDLNFESPEIITADNTEDAGVIVAKGNFAGIYNCKVTDAKITANSGSKLDLGGIAGDMSNGCAIAGCLFQGNVTGSVDAAAFGGLAGFAGKSMIVASYVNCNFDINATGKGLFLARSGSANKAPIRIIGCYYAGANDFSSLKFVADRADNATDVISCSKNKFAGMDINNINTALNGGYAATNIEGEGSGAVNANCILLQLDAIYKYNFKENKESDSGTYPYMVENVAGGK